MNSLKERLEAWLNVRAGEWGELFFFWLFNTLIWTGLAIGEAVAEALFLKRVGVESLPMMFIVCSLVAIPLSLAFGRMQTRVQPLRLALGLNLGAALLVLVSLGLLRSGLAWAGMPVGAPFLYILQASLGTLLTTHFSILLSGRFSTLDAKRLLPLIFSGAVTGSMAGGLLLNSLAVSWGIERLLSLWILLLTTSTIWLLIFRNRLATMERLEEDHAAPQFGGGGLLERFRYEARSVLGSPLLAMLAVSMLLMTVTRYFIEYQYSDIFSRAFDDETRLARFFGIYTIASNILALLVQGLVTGRMIQVFGVNNANLFYPCSTLVAFVGLSLWYWVPAGILARFNQEGLRRAVFQPVSNLFYNAIPPKRRARSIAFNEGIVVPVGAVIAGLVLLALPGRPLAVSILAVALSLLWIAISRQQRDIYSQSLLEMLKRSQIGTLSADEKGLGVFDPKTQFLVMDALKDSNDEVVEVAAELLLHFGRPSARLALLRFASTGRPGVQLVLLRKLSRIPGDDTRAFLLRCLESNDEKVRLTAVRTLAFYPHDDEIRHRIAEFLESPDHRFRAAAAAVMVRAGDLVTMMKALVILQRLLFSSNAAEVLLGITSLGETGDERFWVNLRPHLRSPQAHVRLAAMRSMHDMVQAGEVQEHLDLLQQLLGDPVREIRSLAIRIVSRVRSPRAMSILIEALGDLSPRNRRLALEALAENGQESVPELLMVLDDPRASIYAQEGAVRLLSLCQDTIVRERLARFGLDRIRALYDLKMDEKSIRDDLPLEDGEYLSMVLDEKAHGLLRVVLAMVAPDRASQAARTVFKNLSSSNQEMMGQAIEVLQSMGERTLIYHLLPILENLSLDQIVVYGKRAFLVEERSPRMILGRHLLSLDPELRGAAIYTIGRIGLNELAMAVTKVGESEGMDQETRSLCRWALERLGRSFKAKEAPTPA